MFKSTLAFIALYVIANTSSAASYTYSWAGAITGSEPQYNYSDPFGFGSFGSMSSLFPDYSAGKKFELSITIDSSSIDTKTWDQRVCNAQTGQCHDSPQADYAVSNATLTIGSDSWSPQTGTARLSFNDNYFDDEDLIGFYGDFFLPQGMLHFRSYATLNNGTFTLAPLSINPVPYLSPGNYEQSIYLGSSSNQYMLRTYEDLIISVIPIPASAWLFGSALGLMGVMRRQISS